jgi:hypothetical protein
MRLLYAVVFGACLLLAAPNVVYAGTPEQDAYGAVEKWAEAINDHSVPAIVSLYMPDPDYKIPPLDPNVFFLGTKSDVRVKNRDGIVRYFYDLVTKDKPKVEICKQRTSIQVSDAAVLFAGLYVFTLHGDKPGPLLAHYSFLVVKRDAVWRIAHHLSSKWPGTMTACPGS